MLTRLRRVLAKTLLKINVIILSRALLPLKQRKKPLSLPFRQSIRRLKNHQTCFWLAWVILRTNEGRKFKVRALLDQGSAVNFIFESLCQTIRTKRYRASLQVHCFGERYSGVAKSQVPLTLEPCHIQGPLFPLTTFVYQKITSYASSRFKSVDSWPHLNKLSLADPDPFNSHPIYLLIGADLYGALLLNEIKQGSIGTPTAQRTALVNYIRSYRICRLRGWTRLLVKLHVKSTNRLPSSKILGDRGNSFRTAVIGRRSTMRAAFC